MNSSFGFRAVGSVCLAVLMGCGGGDPPPPAAPPKPAGDKPVRAEKASSSAKSSSRTAKDDGKAVSKQEAAKAKVQTKPKSEAKPGTVVFQGEDHLVKAAEKAAASSALYKGIMTVRRPTAAKRPALLVDLALKEAISSKLIEELKAKGVDTDAMQNAEAIRNTAKESGLAVMALTISATEGGDDILQETWEASAPVTGADAEARTDKELDAAFKKAGEKACFESMALALDSLALTLSAREGALAQSLLDEIKARCSDRNEIFRKKAQETHAAIAKAVHERALEMVKHPDPELRLNGLRDLLLENPPGEDVLGIAVELLKDADFTVRSTAAFAVAARKPDTEGLVNVLGEALSDKNNTVTSTARDALIKIGFPAVPALISALAADARYAQVALEAIAPKEPKTILELCKALGSEDAALRKKIFHILSRLGPVAAPAVPTLIPMLESSPDPAMRAQAAAILGRIGVAAEPALPAMEQAIVDGIKEARDAKRNILAELRKIGKNPPPLPVPDPKTATATKDPTGKNAPPPPPPPKIVKRKTLIMKDGKEIVVESFMKVGEEYRVKMPDGEAASYPAADVKEVKVEDVKE